MGRHNVDIRSRATTPVHHREDGASARYHHFGNLDIHFNLMPSGVLQGWHSHGRVDEYFCVTKGEIVMHWLADGHHERRVLVVGDVAYAERTTHTLSNESGSDAEFIVIKALLSDEDRSLLLLSDRVSVDPVSHEE